MPRSPVKNFCQITRKTQLSNFSSKTKMLRFFTLLLLNKSRSRHLEVGKYFHNFRKNAQSRAVFCPQAGLRLRARIWLFLRIISQCQHLKGRFIRSGCFIYLVSKKSINPTKSDALSCRMSSSHPDVQVPGCLQLDGNISVE